jgi:hypothetical protein
MPDSAPPTCPHLISLLRSPFRVSHPVLLRFLITSMLRFLCGIATLHTVRVLGDTGLLPGALLPDVKGIGEFDLEDRV